MNTNFVTHDVSYFDRVRGAYWYCNDHLDGQGSDTYMVLSLLSEIYSPGLNESSDDLEDDARVHYDNLCSNNAED